MNGSIEQHNNSGSLISGVSPSFVRGFIVGIADNYFGHVVSGML